MASKIDEFIKVNSTIEKGPRCSVRLFLNRTDIPQAERDSVERALLERSVPATVLSRATVAIGHEITPIAIQRHRRNECRCQANAK